MIFPLTFYLIFVLLRLQRLKVKEATDAKNARSGKAAKVDFLSLFHTTQMCSMYLQRKGEPMFIQIVFVRVRR